MTFFCLSDKASSLGFRLAGIETMEVSSRSEALEALKVARSDSRIGIIIVTEKAGLFIQDEIKAQISDKLLPLVLEVPSRGGAVKRKSAAELLKELAGIGV